jgi:glycosyltransferase involved in cell wall biosynthesis
MVIHERSPLRLAAAMSRPARQALYTRLVREANALITLNGHLAAQLQRVGRQPVHVIPAGADPASASAAEAPRPERYAASVVVLCVGAFIPRKGHDMLLRAVERLRPSQLNLHVILIGGGPQRRAVERQIAQRGLEGCVEVWGRRPPREVLAAMSWCDIFALPSWDEAFGTVYAEAMACGRPIVACRGEGIEDVVSDGSQGLLVPARDAEALAGALGRLAADAELRRAMGEAARQLAHSRLTYDVIARTILAIYETLPSAGALHAHLSDLC